MGSQLWKQLVCSAEGYPLYCLGVSGQDQAARPRGELAGQGAARGAEPRSFQVAFLGLLGTSARVLSRAFPLQLLGISMAVLFCAEYYVRRIGT